MCEDVARTVHISRQLGEPRADRAGRHRRAVRPLPERLRTGVPRVKPQIWFLTGSQHLYGPETLDQVAASPQQIQQLLRRRAAARRRDRRQAGAHRQRRRSGTVMLEANADPACLGVIAWMHTFSPAKMWITGLDALRKPLLHLHTQLNAGAAVGVHRHGLHEPEPGRARRPGVRLHPDPARRGPQDGRRARRRPGGGRADRRLGPGRGRRRRTCAACGWPASATTCATSRSPRATRSRPSCGSASRSTRTG